MSSLTKQHLTSSHFQLQPPTTLLYYPVNTIYLITKRSLRSLGPWGWAQQACEGFLPKMEKESQVFGPETGPSRPVNGSFREWKKKLRSWAHEARPVLLWRFPSQNGKEVSDVWAHETRPSGPWRVASRMEKECRTVINPVN